MLPLRRPEVPEDPDILYQLLQYSWRNRLLRVIADPGDGIDMGLDDQAVGPVGDSGKGAGGNKLGTAHRV